MEIIVGKTAGFCYGVKRAVEGAKKEVKESGKITCLGEIVHNKEVIKKLKKEGICFIETIEEAESKVIVRAHGIPKEVYEEAKKKNIEIKDYTCPNVLKIHEIAQEYAKLCYYIFLLGEPNHPENIGTISYCGNHYSVIDKIEEIYRAIEKLEKSKIKKLLVISQTTYSLERFYIIEEIINNELSKDIKIEVKNTICKATEIRQKETEEISKQVELMIIIGGKNSSNTKKLYEIAQKNCKQSICVETKEELVEKNFVGINKIGIMAGASTPEESIREVENFLKEQ